MIERRRHHDRRQAGPGRLGERAMRCQGCGTVWYSAVAGSVVRWGRCIRCNSGLHLERRSGSDRRSHVRTHAAA